MIVWNNICLWLPTYKSTNDAVIYRQLARKQRFGIASCEVYVAPNSQWDVFSLYALMIHVPVKNLIFFC